MAKRKAATRSTTSSAGKAPSKTSPSAAKSPSADKAPKVEKPSPPQEKPKGPKYLVLNPEALNPTAKGIQETLNEYADQGYRLSVVATVTSMRSDIMVLERIE